MVLGVVMITRGVSAQNAISSIYFPYPPDLIPLDLVPEKTNKKAEALTQLPVLPINSGTAMRQVQMLVKLDFSTRISRLTVPAAKNAGYVSLEVAAWNLDSLCVIECAAHHIHPERQTAKGVIYESSNVI
jgi:hypothetical protein